MSTRTISILFEMYFLFSSLVIFHTANFNTKSNNYTTIANGRIDFFFLSIVFRAYANYMDKKCNSKFLRKKNTRKYDEALETSGYWCL